MRLFIALNIGEKMKNALIAIQSKMKDRGIIGNYTQINNLHLTLVFIGEYNDPKKIETVMRRIRFAPFRLSLGKCGSFGDLLWAGLDVPDALNKYVLSLKEELKKENVPFNEKKFVPHITLVRRASKMPENGLNSEASETFSRVSLMRSVRTDRGMVYTEVGYSLSSI